MKNENLTNEELGKNFSDRFQMTNFAILVARDYIIKHEEEGGGSLREILGVVKEMSKEHKANQDG